MDLASVEVRVSRDGRYSNRIQARYGRGIAARRANGHETYRAGRGRRPSIVSIRCLFDRAPRTVEYGYAVGLVQDVCGPEIVVRNCRVTAKRTNRRCI